MAQTVDEVVVISRGRLVAQGSLEELTQGAEAPIWVRSPEAERLRAALDAKGIDAEPGEAGRMAPGEGASLETVGTTAAENGIPVFELYRPRQSLESVFLELTSEPGGGHDPAGRRRALEAAHHAHVLADGGADRRPAAPDPGADARHHDSFSSENDVRSLLSSASIAGLLTLVLGVVAGAGEYRHGTIASTLLVTPQRLRAVSASAGLCGGGLAIGPRVRVLTAVIALPWLTADDAAMPTTGEI